MGVSPSDAPELDSGPPSLGGDPELPNILFSKPPWEEKLLLLLPATLLTSAIVSREETRVDLKGILEEGLGSVVGRDGIRFLALTW